jgi:hypothetical protein
LGFYDLGFTCNIVNEGHGNPPPIAHANAEYKSDTDDTKASKTEKRRDKCEGEKKTRTPITWTMPV